jgi:hypothetical protein
MVAFAQARDKSCIPLGAACWLSVHVALIVVLRNVCDSMLEAANGLELFHMA